MRRVLLRLFSNEISKLEGFRILETWLVKCSFDWISGVALILGATHEFMYD